MRLMTLLAPDYRRFHPENCGLISVSSSLNDAGLDGKWSRDPTE